MKRRWGIVGGFLFGMGGFLLLFKWLVLDTTPPADELAPGAVVLLSIMNGVVFALVGRWIHRRLDTIADTMESEI